MDRPTLIMTNYGQMKVDYQKYLGGRVCIRLYNHEGPFGTLTVNIPPIELEEGEFCVKTWSENTLFIDDCRPYFIDTGKRYRTGFTIAEVWRFKD